MEATGEKAYIIGHVQPGGSDCLYEWSIRYRALIERYQHLVLFHLFGHTHQEFWHVFTDTKNATGINTMHGPGGVTTYKKNNPAFKIYDIDYETGYPVKSHKYYFNLTKANLGDPSWEYAFEMTEEYNLKDMSPQSFTDFSKRFLTEEGLATKWEKNKRSNSEAVKDATCDTEECKRQCYCDHYTLVYFEDRDCRGQKRIDYVQDTVNSVYETFFDPWVVRVD